MGTGYNYSLPGSKAVSLYNYRKFMRLNIFLCRFKFGKYLIFRSRYAMPLEEILGKDL